MCVGFAHACAITADARVKCWGGCHEGQCGAETVENLRESSQLEVMMNTDRSEYGTAKILRNSKGQCFIQKQLVIGSI